MRDAKLKLSIGQTILSSAASTNVMDTLKQVSSLYGQSPQVSTNKNAVPTTLGQHPKKFFFVSQVTYGASGGTAGVGVAFALQDSLTGGGSFATNLTTKSFTKGTLVAGFLAAKFALPEPLREFIQGYYTFSGGTFSALKVDTWLDVY